MAGNYDRFWGRSKGTRSQFRLEGLQPFKCTYPVHLTDIMDGGQSSQSSSQRTQFATSPLKETQTKAVREYEETISLLRKENFDLKVRLFLCEEAHKQTYHVKRHDDEKEDCIQFIVNLRLEADALKKELTGKEDELQSALDKCAEEIEKYQSDLVEARKKINEQKEFIGILEQLPTFEDYKEVQKQYYEIVSEKECLKQRLTEKDQEIEKANLESKELQDKVTALNKKIKLRDEAIRSCARKYHEETDHIPKHLRPIIKSTIQAAANNNETELRSSLEDFKRALSEIMGVPIPSNLQSAYGKDSFGKSSSSAHSSGLSENSFKKKDSCASDVGANSVFQQNESDCFEGDLEETEILTSNEKSDTNIDTVFKLRNENENLLKKIEEKVKIIEKLTSDLSVKEESELELKDKLGEAYTKINSFEEYIKNNSITRDTDKEDCFSQTDISWNSLKSRISDKDLQDFGTSDCISELKEEILMLILALEQKDKKLSDFNQKFLSQSSLFTPIDEDYNTERDELQRRLAISYSVNNELLKHLQSLEKFMEELLQQKNVSTSSLENINESADFLERFSNHLVKSLELSQSLSDQLSFCEGSRFFGLNDTTMQRSVSDRKSIGLQDSQFSQEESDITNIHQGGRRNFYSSVKENQNILGSGKLNLSDIYSSQKLQSFTGNKLSTDTLIGNPDNVVVLKTSNNEDLILLLNDQGDPKDVLIRNNGSHNKTSDQHRRRCWDTPTNNDFWNSEKFAAQYKENVYNVENSNVFKSNYMRYNTWMSSDSDTWSEPDRNVSMQRIGIDVQTSPITSRSPRKSRFKDRRVAEDSTKNESASSYVKLHSFSKRRRSSETSKTSFICKKCQRQSQQHDDTLQEENSNVNFQELQQLYDENSSHQHEIENLTEMLKHKEELIDSLNKEKNVLMSSINDLKEELTELQRANDSLISKQNESSLNEEKNVLMNNINDLKEELTELRKVNDSLISKQNQSSLKLQEKDSLNEELRGIIKTLEKSSESSKTEINKLQKELNQTKDSLVALDKKCAKYENDKAELQQKLASSEQNKKELLENIKDMTNQKDSLLNKLKQEEKRAENVAKENMEMGDKVRAANKENLNLQNSNKELKELNTSLLNAKASVETILESSKSENDTLKSEIKNLSESIKKLKSKCDSFKAEKNALTNSKKNIIDLLLNFEKSFQSNLNILSNACNEKYDLNAKNSKDVEEMRYLVDEDKHVNALLKNIILENEKFAEIASNFKKEIESVKKIKQTAEAEKRKSSSLEHQIILKDEEIKTLNDEIDKLHSLNDEMNELQNEAEAYKADRELLIKLKNELKERENLIRSLETKNGELKESIKTLQNEKNSNEQALKSANEEISSLRSRLLTEKSSEKYENLLKEKQFKIDELLKQIQPEQVAKSGTEVLQTQKRILEEKENQIKTLETKKLDLETNIKILKKKKNSSEQTIEATNAEISSLKEHLVKLQESNEDYKNSLDFKQKEINKLQERILSLQLQIDELLTKKMNQRGLSPSFVKEAPEKATSPDSSTIVEASSNSIPHSVSTSLNSDNSASSVKLIQSDEMISSDAAKKDREKYLRHIKSLQRRLEETDRRNEVLEKEKNSLRENLLSCVQSSKRNSTEKAEEENLKVTELEAKLETKQSFIKELRADLYKAHDSLIDRQKEIDKLKRELFKLKKLNEDNLRTISTNIPGRLSDNFLLSTKATISDLKKHKKKLINSLLDLQKQFYEAKKVDVNQFERFTRYIESLRALQVSPSLLKSESAPLLDRYSLNLSVEQGKTEDRTLKNEKIDLEIDIECLQNFKMFLKRFFPPKMNQSSDNETKNNKVVPTDLQEVITKSTKDKDLRSRLTPEKYSNVRRLQMDNEESSHDRLAAIASKISSKLDCMENVLKTVIDGFELLNDMVSVINETAGGVDAKSILQKLYNSVISLQENEVFYLNSRLKSLELFDNDQHRFSSKQDSDHESLLSDETIALSRSASLSPVSFDGQYAPNLVHQKQQTLIHSYIKQTEEIKRIPLRPSHKVISSSQDSVFQRSHYSSPDLGIESDPNHEHSAPEEVDKFHSTKISTSRHDLSGSAMYRNLDRQRLSSINSFSDSSFKVRDRSLPFVVGSTLHAIGLLQDYELLKKEISESIVGIKSILSRTGDGMQHISSNASSPRKLQKLEYSTFKAIKDTCLNLDVCLEKANKLVNSFWVATCPTEDEWRQLLHQNEKMNYELKRMTELKKKQEKDFQDAFDRLKQAETIKEQQEQKISKKLVKTKKIIRQAEKKILESRNKEHPLLVQRSSKPSLNPL